MKPIKIALFDDSNEELAAISRAFVGMFAREGIVVETNPRVIDTKSDNFMKDLKKCRPELMVFDNYFGSTISEQTYGQSLISELKEEFPDSVFVLVTKENIRKDSLDKKTPMPDIIASKQGVELAYDDYVEWLLKEISKKLTRARIDQIEYSACKKIFANLKSRSLKGPRRPIQDQEIESLVQQVCHTGGKILENVLQGVRLEPLTGGQSGAAVCTISVENKFGSYNVPAVIKFMQKEAAHDEAHNHAKFVKWVLPYRWRVDLIGRGTTDEFGAVCYSFAHGGTGTPETLSSLIQNSEFDRISTVMRSVFDREYQAWYSNQRTISTSVGHYLARSAPYFFKPDDDTKREEGLIREIDAMAEEENLEFFEVGNEFALKVDGGVLQLSSILSRITSIRSLPNTVECLSHGDLNSGNILVRSGATEFCFIDFQHTGWHHRARDFCSLEGSIRTLQFEKRNRTFVERINEEIQAWDRANTKKFGGVESFRLIDELRFLYFQNHDSSVLELAMASFIHTWWLLSFSSWNTFQRRRLLSYFLATLFCIQENMLEAGE